MKRILWISDGVVKTGFSTVATNIIKNLDKEEYEIHHLAINYNGDPHEYKWKIYPASSGGDLWGFGRIRHFSEGNLDGIFMLNDPWVIATYLSEIKKRFKKIPPIVVYFPVDAKFLDKDWFEDYDVVNKVVVYTEFGKKEVLTADPSLESKIEIVPHGVDTGVFYKMKKDKREIKESLYGEKDEYVDSFIVLSAARNQPRKRLDIAFEGFTLFSQDKPENVKFYVHCGMRDVGWYIPKMAQRYGLTNRLIVTSQENTIQQVPETKLNLIYNATDVGLNTSLGEGWSLPNHEHAATGAPQIVPDHSALHELYKDVGILMPLYGHIVNTETLTMSFFVSPDAVAESLQLFYVNKDLYNKASNRSIEKFTSKDFIWENIVKEKWNPIFKEAYNP